MHKKKQLDQYKNILKNNDLKLTKKRISMIEIFENTDRYLSAKYIHEKMSEKYPQISYDTIYRNLYTLNKVNILEQSTFDGEMHYTIVCSDKHHHHFICESCGLIKVIHHCPISTWQDEIPDAKINNHKIELYGLCVQCQKELCK